MTDPSVLALESDILHTRARLHDSLAAIAAKLEPARLAERAQSALFRRLSALASARPAAAAAIAFGLGLTLAVVRRSQRRRLLSHT